MKSLAWAIIALLAIPSHAQDVKPVVAATLPDAPTPKTMPVVPVVHRVRTVDRHYVVIMSLLAAAKTADALSTERGLACGNAESNALFGPHPSPGRVAVTDGLYFAGEAAMAYGIKRLGRHHWWGRLWIVEPVYQAQQHIHLAYQNYGWACHH